MLDKKSIRVLFFSLNCIVVAAQASTEIEEKFRYRFYVGGAGGYGSTTWNGLVPSKTNESAAINMSTPVIVNEGGAVWSVFTGYEFSPYFALEASYMHYPDAKVNFDPMSLFTFENDGKTSLTTHTEMASLMGKIMLIIPRTSIRAYSSAGVADIHRRDEIVDRWRVSPTFGVGLNYNVTPHLMGELAANYTSGYGESELSPVKDYIPFLYSVVFRLAYRI